MENKKQENVWRISYAEELVRKTDGYRRSLCTPQPDSVLGICMDTEGIHVRIWQDGESRPVCSMPAYYLLDDLEEILAGYRAVVHAKVNREKNLHSMLAFMQEADRMVDSTLESAGVRYCTVLMRELKKELEKTAAARIKACVVTTCVPDIVTQKNVKTAMEKAGFRVLRCMSAVEACAVSKAYRMNESRQFLVRVIADHKWQSLMAEYTSCPGGTAMLESLQYTFGDRIPEDAQGLSCYHISDDRSRNGSDTERRGYEELSVAAADGAAAQGARLRGKMAHPITLLALFPWRIGIEIYTIRWGRDCLPLTWISDEQMVLPVKTEKVDLSLDTGIAGKKLSMYLEMDGYKRKIRNWELEEICPEFSKDTSRLQVWLDVGMEGGELQLVLQAEDKKAVVNLNRYREENIGQIPITATFVPDEMVREVLLAGEAFCQGAEDLDPVSADSAIGKGIRLIARQVQEVLAEYRHRDPQIRVGTWIETMLTLKDQLEYGIAGAERTTKRMEYQKEKLLMMDFRKILKHNLYRLHITPVEANGEIFDPYIHEALQTEKAELLEKGRVIREIQKGYFFGEKLYRPARVIVSQKKAGK